ncbi:MAG: sigma-70 family RNA polymerase sigma factor [Ilumatobacteraceae bacterium]|nr:sigma-70 family RNA polymerase sigma factor [Ilumatobacteraceae bacterium]
MRSVPTPTEADRRARFEAVAAEVYEPVQRYLARRATPDDAADVLADTLLVVWRRLDDVPDEPLPWTYGVARRSLANLRRSAVRRLRLVERAASMPDDTATSDPQAAIDTSEPDLMAAIGELSESEREVVHLWAWERLEPREIAVVLDTTPNAVSVALSRAKRKLAERLDRQDRDDGGHLQGAGTDQTGARTPEQEGGPR